MNDRGPRPVRCAALYRVSTARQAQNKGEDEESLPLQRTAIRRFVESHPDWTLVAEFAEEGVSAYKHSSHDRDVLQDAVRQAKRGAFDILLVFKADRLSRQAMEYPFILSTLNRAGVRVFSVADEPGGKELKVDGQYEKLLRFIEGWQAETESLNTSIRVSERMRQLAEQGRWTGGRAPYGYRYDPSRRPIPLVVDEAEAAMIRQVFTDYLDHNLGTPTIAAQLNAAGYRQRNGNRWSDSMLRRVMQNPIVTGRLAYGRTSQGRDGFRRKRPHDLEGVILSPPYPELVIIPQARWEVAMDKMAHYNARRSRRIPRHTRADSGPLLFTGLARCGHCGGPLVSTRVTSCKPTKHGPKKYWHPAYLCQTMATRGREACSGQRTYSAKKVETAILQAMHRTLSHIDHEAILAEARQQAERALWAQTTRKDRLERQLREAQRLHAAWLERLDRHLLHPEQSLYSEDTLAAKVRETERRVAELQEELAELDRTQVDVAQHHARLTQFLQSAGDWWETFLQAPRREQKALLKQILERVVVSRDSVEIHYRVSLEALEQGGRSAPALRWSHKVAWPSA